MADEKKVLLMILDGWGHGTDDQSNAIKHARTPFVDSLYQDWPNAELLTDGEHVGLPKGQMGNSEVGHLNIGAGRIVYQDLVKINKAIESGEMANNKALVKAMDTAMERGAKLHLIGLVSNGGVHSSQDHLHALCDIANARGVKDIMIHAITDGRDCDPRSGGAFIKKLNDHVAGGHARIASICGRYYAMDRDKRWERVSKAYELLVHGTGRSATDPVAAVKASYADGVTDEFILPVVMTNDSGDPIGRIEEGDVVICFNFRTDRCREITMALTQQDFPDHGMKMLDLHYVTMTNYDNTFRNVDVMFDKDNLVNTIGEVIEAHGKTQVRIAETEKYPHVTFFFSGGREQEFNGEKRLLINSPKVATYDLQPEMSAYEVTDTICEELNTNQPDFVCLNFANPDMVGHTGVYDAIVEALEHIDKCASKVIRTCLDHDYAAIVIADHGNADFVVNADGSPNTAHTTNPVPVFLINSGRHSVSNGILADVAPTILDLMKIEQPAEMTGSSLVQ